MIWVRKMCNMRRQTLGQNPEHHEIKEPTLGLRNKPSEAGVKLRKATLQKQ
jgi:hypothetical protein